MTHFRLSGIQRSVLIIAVLPVAAVTLLLSVFFSISQSRELERSLHERGFAITRQLGPASEYGVFSGNPDILRPLIDAVMKEADVRAAAISNAANKTLIASGPPIGSTNDIAQSTDTATSTLSREASSIIFRAPIHRTEYPIDDVFDDATGGIQAAAVSEAEPILGWVTVELSLERTHAYQSMTWLRTGLIAGLAVLLSGLMALRIGRGITAPIIALHNTVQQLESGRLDTRVHTGDSGELGALESGVNAMADALQASYANLEDKVARATAELRDTLTVLEQRNDELEAARHEAESANKAKSHFLANISHEIRTPLNGIQGFLMLLSKTGTDQTQQDYIEKIETSTRTLLTLLNDVLDFSKLEVSRLKVVDVEFDLRQLLEDCIYVGLAEAQRKRIELSLIVDADLDDRFYGAADRIAQVVKNLISNAVKFTAQGEVSVHAEQAGKADDILTLRISVTDTGIGISNKERERLFQPFSQLEAGKNRSYGGSGLGLAISKSLVELMGGEISVDSIAGRGSCFAVSLPLHICSQDGHVSVRTERLRDHRVLIVSDSSSFSLGLQQMLLHWGAHVELASDAASAGVTLAETRGTGKSLTALMIDSSLGAAELTLILDAASGTGNKAFSSAVLLNRTDSGIHEDTQLRRRLGASLTYPPRAAQIADTLDRIITNTLDQPQHVTSDAAVPLQYTADQQTPRVLLADDNAINRQFLSTWLKQALIDVDEVSDGSTAIIHCGHQTYDLILMDLHMPDVDGLAAAAQIHSHESRNENTPIIAITADATEETRDELTHSSIADYLLKPVTEQDLLGVINTYIKPHKASTAARVTSGQNAERTDRLQPSDNVTIVDTAEGLRLASGNAELWHWSLHNLASRLDQQMCEIQSSIDDGDFGRLGQLAHSIVGSAGYCGARELLETAGSIEDAARAQDGDAARQRIEQLYAAISHFQSWVNSRITEPTASDE